MSFLSLKNDGEVQHLILEQSFVLGLGLRPVRTRLMIQS